MGLLTRILSKVRPSKSVTSSWAIKLVEERLFDSEWYLKAYPDVAKNRIWAKHPVEHFLTIGGVKGQSPGVWFDSAWYLKQNKDVARAGVNPLLHYLSHGMQEGRKRSQVITLLPDKEPFQFFVVSKEGVSWCLPIVGDMYQYSCSTMFQCIDENPADNRCGIVLIKCFGANAEELSAKVEGLSWSEHYKSWYRYLVQRPSQPITSDNFILTFPQGTKFCQVLIKPWINNSFVLRNTLDIVPKSNAINKLEAKQSALNNSAGRGRVKASEIKVAFIADEFTYNSFRDEFQPILLEPDSWRQQFEQEQPQIFFCESAWSGADSKYRPWKGKIYASKNFARENRQILIDILAYCNQKKIPTLFWNKEDPTHYSDRVHDFVKTAALFDYVFTSASECVEQYKKDYGLKRVFALPFATNPKLFNPFTGENRSDEIVFAGSWYANHLERSAVMENILDSLIAVGFTPKIYDRYYGGDDPLHVWPDKYQKYINPGLPHDQMPNVYKSSVFGLNFNTVTESSTMFARRVFELMSSNSLVISNYSKGVDEMFGDLVIFADKQRNRLTNLTPKDVSDLREKALMKVLSEHTYKQRWNYILQCIGFNTLPENNDVTLVAEVRNISEANIAISYYEQYFSRDNNFKLLLLVSIEVPDIEVANFYQIFNRFGITVTSQSYIKKHASSESYNPIDTPFFVLFKAGNIAQPEWVKKACMHASYMDKTIFTIANSEPYIPAIAKSDVAIAGQASLFLPSLNKQMEGENISAFTI
jgi:spore maturation protein CgeB